MADVRAETVVCQYLGGKGCSGNYPRGGHIFFRPLHPQDKHGVGAPRPPGHVSALINPPHYGSNVPWPPGQVTPQPPTPRTRQQTPPHRTKKCLQPTPQDNFWNSPKCKLIWTCTDLLWMSCIIPCHVQWHFIDQMRTGSGTEVDVPFKYSKRFQNQTKPTQDTVIVKTDCLSDYTAVLVKMTWTSLLFSNGFFQWGLLDATMLCQCGN